MVAVTLALRSSQCACQRVEFVGGDGSQPARFTVDVPLARGVAEVTAQTISHSDPTATNTPAEPDAELFRSAHKRVGTRVVAPRPFFGAEHVDAVQLRRVPLFGSPA